MAQVTYNEREFRNELGLIAQISGKALSEVIDEQAGLFLKDASSFTPPFGKAPVKEGSAAKKKIGMTAVKRDIERGFFPLENLGFYRNDSAGPAGDLGRALRRAVRKRDPLLVEMIFNNIGGKFRGRNVVLAPTVDLHNSMRDRRGRVAKRRGYFTLSGQAALNKFIKTKQANIGLGKAGWNDPLHGLKLTAFAWVEKQSRSRGIFQREAGDAPSVTVGNTVPFVQDSAPRIEQQAWNNRMRNATKQREALERWQRKKLREGGIKPS
jgi:hypothetical protein